MSAGCDVGVKEAVANEARNTVERLSDPGGARESVQAATQESEQPVSLEGWRNVNTIGNGMR